MKPSNRWLGLLGATVVLSFARVSAYSSLTSLGCLTFGYADGLCDDGNNRAECGYDGGDCCSCTCVDTVDYTCGILGFACIDPEATCVDDDDITADIAENCGKLNRIGNGSCGQDNNKAECGYDGGDCCSCTCTAPDPGRGNECSDFACIDPAATCVDDDDITAEMVENCERVDSIGDGDCDQGNNKAECGYDGGDCCPCTCTAPDTDRGDYCSDFACIDPAATCVDDDDITAEMVTNCDNVVGIGDGNCDLYNNNAECGYDGGDCCSCTCIVPENPRHYFGLCDNFVCVDPEATCAEDDDITADMMENCGNVEAVGNGYCEEDNNNALCYYDGGDCCECTCVSREVDDDDYVSCGGGFACIDPEAACVNDDDITTDIVANCDSVRVGNGDCDQRNNNAECGYDGGDCCECTCEDRPNQKCGQYGGYICIDPEAACVNDDITVDMVDLCQYPGGIGDGYCDDGNNKPECGGWDGGDCCSCTCINPLDDDWACSADGAGFYCLDTSAPCYGENPYLSTTDDEEPMSYVFVDDSVPWEQEGPLPTLEGAVEVGTKTEVSVSATAHDVRPGARGGEPGCGDVGGDGCAPVNTRDGISSESESRWSCSMELVEDEGPCVIEYIFGEPQDIMDIQVAFWKEEERTRTIDIHFDGVRVDTHESNAESAFNAIGVSGTGVTTVALESKDLFPSEWVSILEVLIFVTP